MALEIKGLSSSLAEAKMAIAIARRATTDVGTAARTLAMNAHDVKRQLEKHNSDLLFEVGTLGNSPPPEEQRPEPPLLSLKVFTDDAAEKKKVDDITADLFHQPGAGGGAAGGAADDLEKSS